MVSDYKLKGKHYPMVLKATVPRVLFDLLMQECNNKKMHKNKIIAEMLYERYYRLGMIQTSLEDLYLFKGDRK